MTLASDTLLSDLQAHARELGRAPTFREYDDRGQYGACTIQRRYGSWNDALRAAGLDVRRRREITREDVAQDIRRVASDLGRAPSVSEYTDRGQYSVSTAVDRFGSWSDAKAAHDLVLVPTSTRGKYHSIAAMDSPETACSVGPSGVGSFRFVGRSRADEHWDPCRLCFPDESPEVEQADALREAVASASTVRDVAEELRLPYEEARRQLDRCGLLDRLLTAEEIIERAAEAD